jgi:Ni2+-binding GTPase involved in maturation of urease and hydrogenase
MAVVTNDIYTAEDASFWSITRRWRGAHHRRGDRRLPATAIREDASINLKPSIACSAPSRTSS